MRCGISTQSFIKIYIYISMSTVYVLCNDRQACACACLNRGQSLPSLCPGSRAGELDVPALRDAGIGPLCVPPFVSGDPAGAADPILQHYPEHPPSRAKPRPRWRGRQEARWVVLIHRRAALGLGQVSELRGALQKTSSGKKEGGKLLVFVVSLTYSAPGLVILVRNKFLFGLFSLNVLQPAVSPVLLGFFVYC